MLSCDEQADLAAALVATAETLGQEMSANAAKLMAKDLAEYPGEAIRSALQACRRELTGKLTLAAILQRVQAVDGRPEPNEAWALALEASDERATVVLTPEIQEALTIAAPILEARDKVGARMAFISAYERAVSRSRREALPVEWRVSLGHDEAGQRPEVLCMLRTLIKENGEAQQAVANLVDGADDQELQEAHWELSESRAATDEALRMIDQMRRPRLVQG
ncbi:TPA: hypothetical protein ACGSS8_001120 [Pseudomonas aeruginosa]